MNPQTLEPRNPYPGLRPFEPADAAFFVGREVVLRRLDQQVRLAPITVLFARSGMGKSSFLTCRLLPHFARTGGVVYINEWGGAAPAQLIERHLEAQEASEGTATVEFPLLVLDQFEDVFKLPGDLRALWRFLSRVVHGQPARARLLISIREEWLGAWWDVADDIDQAVDSMIRLGPLTDRELRDAVLAPARGEGSVTVEPKLPARLLQDLRVTNLFGNGTYVEPGLVQLICNRLWSEARAPGRSMSMSLDLYQRLGGAQRLVREHVWRHLAAPQTHGGAFAPPDRALWVGLSRHLTLVRGVKSVVTPSQLAQRLRIEDLGLAGRAVVEGGVGRRACAYLKPLPEKRQGIPPAPLLDWITRVLERAVEIRLMKKQANQGDDDGASRYELCHDALTDMLQEFCGEFELMVQRGRRRARLVTLGFASGVITAIILAVYIGASWHEGKLPQMQILQILITVPLISIAYVAMFWGILKLYGWMGERGLFFLLRRAIGGVVPLPLDGPPPAQTTAATERPVPIAKAS